MQYIQLDCFVVKETKSDNIFASAQFMLNDYEVRARINRDKNGCGLIEYVRGGVICWRLKHLERAISELSIKSKYLLAQNSQFLKEIFCISIHRPLNYSNLENICNEITTSLNKASLD